MQQHTAAQVLVCSFGRRDCFGCLSHFERVVGAIVLKVDSTVGLGRTQISRARVGASLAFRSKGAQAQPAGQRAGIGRSRRTRGLLWARR